MAKDVKSKSTTPPKAKAPARTRARTRTATSKKSTIQSRHKAKTKSAAKPNEAQNIIQVAEMIQAGHTRDQIAEALKRDIDGEYETLHRRAVAYLKNNKLRNQVEFYAHHIKELQYLYDLSIGKVQQPDTEAARRFAKLDYAQSLRIRIELKEAHAELDMVLAFT